MAVVHHDFANFADGVLMHQIVGGMIAAIPGGLVVDQDGDLGRAGSTFDGAGIFVTYGQWLFHHDWDGVLCADFHGAAMIIGVGVDEHGLRTGGGEQFVEIGVVQIWIKGEFGGVAVEDFAVGLRNANDLDVAPIFSPGEEAVSVAVRESGHGDAKRSDRCVADRR